MCREYGTLEDSVLNKISPEVPFPHSSWNPVEKETERFSEPEGMENTKETRLT